MKHHYIIYMITEILKERPAQPVQLIVGLEDLKAIVSEVIEETSRRKAVIDHVPDIGGNSDTERYLSKAKVIQMLRISSSTLWRWNRTGLLKIYKIGGRSVYKGSELTKFLEEHGSRII